MSLLVILGFAVGAVLCASVLLLIAAAAGWRPTIPRSGPSRPTRLQRASVDIGRRAAVAVAAGAGVAVLTRWPVMACTAAVLVYAWPIMFGAARESASKIERLEAVATWTESLRDTIAGSIALEEAIRNSASAAPPAIQAPLQRMVGALSVHVPLPQALAQFAEDFEDESIDLVVAALILNSKLRGPGLVATLTALATSAREELDMRRRIEQERLTLRRDARTIMLWSVGFAAVLAMFSRSYMAPYGTVPGQFMLAIVIGIFVSGLVWMRKLADVRAHERFLVGPETLATPHGSKRAPLRPATRVRA
jgi:Flp pilus assembly protein TadB